MGTQTRVVMITGAAGSLGRAVAETFAAAGARLALIDLSDEALRTAYPGGEGQGLTVPVDLLDASAVHRAVARIQQHFGRIDALCNIAGGFIMGMPVHSTPAADWQRMIDVNVQTVIHAVQAVVPVMLSRGGGRIVNVAAGAGQKGQALMAPYCVAKSAVIRITEAMAAELREQGINVNCVLPSIIDTPANRAAMPDADPGRWVAPRDLAAVIGFLCSDAARAVHGAAIPVNGLS